MSNTILKTGLAACALTLAAGSAHSATLGLATIGDIDAGMGDVTAFGAGEISGFPTLATAGASNFFYGPLLLSSSFDSGSDVGNIVDYGFSGEVMEFELQPYDSYTNGALLKVDLTGAGLTSDGDLAAEILAMPSFLFSTANYTVQALAPVPAPVPLPAGILLLGTALASVAFAKRRTKM